MSLIITVGLLHLLALISPGPDFILCARNSLAYSRKMGLWTALGFSGGIAVHMTYCIAGIAVIISQSIILFNIMKWLGALYLIHIGIQSWRAKSTTIHIDAHKHKHMISAFQAVKMGFLTNALNPKATLFFLSAFTLIISPSTPLWIQLAIGVWCVVQTFLWFGFVATVLTIPRVRRVFERFQGFFNKFFWGALVVLGIKVATTD